MALTPHSYQIGPAHIQASTTDTARLNVRIGLQARYQVERHPTTSARSASRQISSLPGGI